MKYKIVNLELKTDRKLQTTPSKVRGFIGNTYEQYPILHNHYGDDKFLYSYPFVQYKILNNKIHILGIDEGGEILKEIAGDLSKLTLDRDYEITEKLIFEREVDIKPTSEEMHYEFITPWIGLNQKNYQKYMKTNDWFEKKELINRILVGNILSMSKGLGIIVNKRLYAKTHFSQKIVHYKGVKMNAFVGEFKIHYNIPDYFGLGKGVSQGFGCVKKINNDE